MRIAPRALDDPFEDLSGAVLAELMGYRIARKLAPACDCETGFGLGSRTREAFGRLSIPFHFPSHLSTLSFGSEFFTGRAVSTWQNKKYAWGYTSVQEQ